VIRIEDFAADEVLDDMNIDDAFDLLGLFQGVGLPFRAESALPLHMPNMIWLYHRSVVLAKAPATRPAASAYAGGFTSWP
jgi:predicted Zn-dependent protease with MMP-like domain